MVKLAFNWGVSSFYGWGVYGLNLALQASDRFDLLCGSEFGPDDVLLDPVREKKIAALAKRSAPLWGIGSHCTDYPVLRAMMNDLVTAPSAQGHHMAGQPSIGVLFMELAALSREGKDRAKQFPVIVAGCSWNERVLRDQGVTNVTTVLQGVDTSLFHPAPKANLYPGRFVIFSGGKLEFRKGQDIVLAAFRAFHQRHPEALLLAAWDSPWSAQLAGEAVMRKDIEPVPRGANGKPDIVRWAVNNGIPEDAIVAVPGTPNVLMPQVIREADVALFPNRCEGGTNLAAMECMACGVETILSRNTGHLDLLEQQSWSYLTRQSSVSHPSLDMTDWGESDVEEVVALLEVAWTCQRPSDEGLPDPVCMIPKDWSVQIDQLLKVVEEHTR